MSERVVIEVAKVHGRGKVHIPKEIRDLLDLEDGNKVYFLRDPKGTIFIEKAPEIKRNKSNGTYQSE